MNFVNQKVCSGWCLPLYLYLALCIFGLGFVGYTIYKNEDVYDNDYTMVIVGIIYKLLWAYVIYYLCSTCKEEWTWVIILVPFVFGLFALIIIIDLLLKAHNQRHHHHNRY